MKQYGIRSAIVIGCLSALSALAVWCVFAHGWTLYYGDAEAHLDIARRTVDSRTPGYDQIGTVWLPAPHALMMLFVGNDWLWRTGLAGAIPAAACFVLAAWFLFGIAGEAFGSKAAAGAACAVFALNPNLLYLQATPMTEACFFAASLGLLYASVRFARTPALGWAAAAGIASCAASLTRYEGWFLIPFVALYFLWRRRWDAALLFGFVAGLAPTYWMAHNWWYFGDALSFYRGPYSAMAIQGGKWYPGVGNWVQSLQYVGTAIRLAAGWPAVLVGAAGLIAAAWRKAWWPLLFLMLSPAFYVWSMHSSGTPIFVPVLWPFSYYNTRYGLAALPLLAFGVGALVAWRPRLALVAVVATAYWWGGVITWKESEVNSVARRQWTREAASVVTGAGGIFSKLNDMAGIYREAGIPFRDVLQEGNEPAWMAAVARPDIFLREEWAEGIEGDEIERTARRAGYTLIREIRVDKEKAVRIFRRNSNGNTVH